MTRPVLVGFLYDLPAREPKVFSNPLKPAGIDGSDPPRAHRSRAMGREHRLTCARLLSI
jgi:hypothetical protein